MYSADDGKPTYNQPQAAATGLPVNYKSSATGYSGASSNYHVPPPQHLVEWSTGLFDCFSDGINFCMTCWCPCVTFGRVAEIVDKGSTSCGASGALYTLITSVVGCGCLYSCFYRTKMRHQYGLKGSDYTDCLIHCFCETCALCQEYRELEHRGFNMKLGWQGNVEQQTQGVAISGITAPTVEHGMTR